MARRMQQGSIVKNGGWYIVRYREDIPGQHQRVQKHLRVCPVQGPHALKRTERRRKAAELLSSIGVNNTQKFQDTTLGITFEQQAKTFMEQATARKRKPIKPATASTWANTIKHTLTPIIGTYMLANINNGSMKELVQALHSKGLSAKTILNYTQLVKAVVSSAVTENGEELFPRKWNSEFIDLPLIGAQNTPTFSEEILGKIVQSSRGYQQVIYALAASTGLRIGEVLGLELKNISADHTTIDVMQSAWEGQLQSPKTPSAIRKVDVNSAMAVLLDAYIGERVTGLLFPSRKGTPLMQSNLLRRDFHPLLERLGVPKTGFHAFRRFRTTWLRKQRAPEDLIKFWLGHSGTSVTDGYSKLGEDVEFRKEVCEKVGTGFSVPFKPTANPEKISSSVHSVHKISEKNEIEIAA